MGVSSLLNIGNHALFASQTAINVTGNNIANVNTDGYSRQSVRFEEFTPINHRPGQLGMGVKAADIYRNFNRFVENSYLDRFSLQQRWQEQSSVMQNVESLFNEANRKGISSSMSSFFTQWSGLANMPDDMPSREALLANSENLTLLMRDAKATLQSNQREMNQFITQSVDEVNNIITSLRGVCKELASTDLPGNNANSLYDERDRLVRKLASYVDIDVIDKGKNDFTVQLKGGQALVSNDSDFSLMLRAPDIEVNAPGFKGELNFDGNDSFEYTLEYVNENEFRVSLDGGKNWLRNDDGTQILYTTPPVGETLKVKNLEISFNDPNYTEGDTVRFKPGDSFVITPKTGLYWSSPTRPPLNITPQTNMDGTDNNQRLVGGKLAAYFNVRDHNLGRYNDKLDAVARSLIWEVNKLHSQGSSSAAFTGLTGSYTTKATDQALGSGMSGLEFGEYLTKGNLSLYFYDSRTGESLANSPVDFDPSTTEIDNFDPSKHSLEDVVNAINNSFADPNDTSVPPRNLIKASIEGGTLKLAAADGVTFKTGTDTTGLLASLGINTYFSGSSATDIGINPYIRQNPSAINTSRVDGAGEGNAGDNAIATAIAKLASQSVRISTTWETSNQSLNDYYVRLVGVVGSETSNAIFNEKYNNSLAKDLDARSSSITGVNMDEEMTSLIRFQHSYTAAAKLITTADEMLQVILGLKQ